MRVDGIEVATCLHGSDHCWWQDCQERPVAWRRLGDHGQILLRECAGHGETPVWLVRATIELGWPHPVATRP